MIRYHGGPITPISAAIAAWKGAHAMISFAHPSQLPVAAEKAHSFALDNGAFSIWKAGQGKVDIAAYLAWINEWKMHPGFDWCLIPDVIDGTEDENNKLIEAWPLFVSMSVPVWHMHESLEKLAWLVDEWPRVAIGSSGQFSAVRTREWWQQIGLAMEVACDAEGRPKAKLHGLRQMDPTIFSHIPYASVDSTMVGRNIGLDVHWGGTYQPRTKETRALILRDNIESHVSAARWNKLGGLQQNLELLG